jgi:hypothetical protein
MEAQERQQAGQDKEDGNHCRQRADRSHGALQHVAWGAPLLCRQGQWLRARDRCLRDSGGQRERARQGWLWHGAQQGDSAAQFGKNMLAALAALQMSIKKSLLLGSKLLIQKG